MTIFVSQSPLKQHFNIMDEFNSVYSVLVCLKIRITFMCITTIIQMYLLPARSKNEIVDFNLFIDPLLICSKDRVNINETLKNSTIKSMIV